MSHLQTVQFIPRRLLSDQRGWFLKILTGTEDHLPTTIGEVYVTNSRPGQVRGNHYHPHTAEWFTVIGGQCEVILSDPATDQQCYFLMSQVYPLTVYIPPGIGHAFRNPSTASDEMMFAMVADRPYDPDDVVPLSLF